jgi:formiminotetrahydrofolate cyclodeaminase
MQVISEQLRSVFEPDLARLFQDDSDVFDRVIQLRRARDDATDPAARRRLNETHLAELRLATDIPVRVSRTCLSVARSGLIVFDVGFRAARGDSGVAISSALAGANGALCVAYLNLTQFRSAEWSITTRQTCDELLAQSQSMQTELFGRVARLQADGEAAPPQLPLFDAVGGS